MDDEETLTAYHEAGHAVVGFALGARIESVQLGGEADDFLPERFGDCMVNWGPVDPNCDWQRQREIMTILAGPVAEMIYRGEKLHPATFGPWQDDWRLAMQIASSLFRSALERTRMLELATAQMHKHMNSTLCWAAIAAVADELLAHEFLEEKQLAETLSFWIRKGE